ncbi:MAG: glycosyltransferase family 39 protein [Bacteroidaceae bacterium]|nr:glycosyltransferase family 39 protein [Bacteroidaceae bacterium]
MKLTNKQIFWLLFAVCVLTLLPFMGLTEYNTKGEPREAIVAYSILDTGNWILPLNSGGDTPFKPMFFYWVVAAVSYILGGVTEFTSRVPSVLSLTAVVVTTFLFYARRRPRAEGIITALICMLCMEMHKTGSICRIDMLLTALTIGAFYMFYRWYEQGIKRIPFIAIILMALGTFAKGPVGFIIPCAVIGLFLLLKGKNFWSVCWKLLLCAIIAFIPFAVWLYFACKMPGGQELYDMLYEENVGRMLHAMGYKSCVEPWWFTTITLVYGLVPFTVIALFSLFSLNHVKHLQCCTDQSVVKRFVSWFKHLDDVTMYSFIGSVLILVFYTIPESKRSSYILPMYSFVAYFIAKLMIWLAENNKKSLTYYTDFLSVCGLLMFVAYIVCKIKIIPETLFEGKHAADNIATLNAIGDISSWWEIILILIPTFVCGYWWVFRKSNQIGHKYIYFSMLIILSIYIAIEGSYKNAVMNLRSVKSDAVAVCALSTELGDVAGHMYEYVEIGEQSKGDKLRMYGMDFYSGDKVDNFKKSQPDSGLLLIGKEDFELRKVDFESQGYYFQGPVYTSLHKLENHQFLEVYLFHK